VGNRPRTAIRRPSPSPKTRRKTIVALDPGPPAQIGPIAADEVAQEMFLGLGRPVVRVPFWRLDLAE
jgi:hypothetical protein